MGRRGNRAEVVVLAGHDGHAAFVSAARRRLTLRWRIALEGGGEVTLECALEEPTADEPGGSLAFSLADGKGRREVECGTAARVSWVRDAESGLQHVDAPGLLACSFEHAEEGAIRVLYARTPVLASVGSGGGRHELAEVHITEVSATGRPLERV
ncbi:MAG: hypothetical protein KIS87_00320 [Phycisphaeraceae bacterium]|nr:hypothetical protein [Phycisphaeraceae bacterium]